MKIRGTTILAVKHRGKVTVAGDGQVTLDTTVMKHGARKVRRLYHNQVIVGFAGATADAFTLFDRFDQKLEQYKGNLLRAAVELTKDWRTDRVLRHLEALMIAVSRDVEKNLNLDFGDRVLLHGLGVFDFQDRMAGRCRSKVDIFMNCKKKAVRFGVRRYVVLVKLV